MKNWFNSNQRIATSLVILLSALSCNEKEKIVPEVTQDLNFVTLNQATELASSIRLPALKGSNPSARNGLIQKKVKNINSVLNENAETILYTINYEGGGFVILSSDNRAMPLLAHSEINQLPVDLRNYPPAFLNWLTYVNVYINDIKKAGKKQTKQQADAWLVCAVQNQASYTGGDDCGGGGTEGGCQDEIEMVAPLLQTAWGQGCGYNNLTPDCNNTTYCNKAITGCVATAMAQVMRYHSFPASYNWGVMPNVPSGFGPSDVGSPEVSQLMKDIGDNVSMNYGCGTGSGDGSSADTKNEVASTLVDDFGYASASYMSYEGTSNYDVVTNELRAQRPVIFRGGENTGWWFFDQYKNGHAWVCDGLIRSYICNPGIGSLYFHMNWGWNGMANGWFAFSNFNPTTNGGTTYEFNYKSGVVVNIKP